MVGWAVLAAAVGSGGCRQRLFDFGVSVIPTDAGTSDVPSGFHPDGTATLPDVSYDFGGGGTGGAGATDGGGAGGTGGGFASCDDSSSDRLTDVSNCGTCFHSCVAPSSTPACVNGQCQITCLPGFFDANNDPTDGCECVQTNGGVEICDGIDNDCNGVVDDGFDFSSDLMNCGGCNRTCSFPFANALCMSGVCTMGTCLPNFYDRDPSVPGCETECLMTNGGVEICDGIDNDCDGVIDDNLGAPTITCLSKGVCSNTHPLCQGQAGWTCTYPSNYQPVEDTTFGCDNADNDCDGQTDEAFDIGKPCTVGTGACVNTGVWQCDTTPSGHKCSASPLPPQPEKCDGIDNDCDGVVDNFVPTGGDQSDDALVFLSGPNVTMYAYEASRFDSTSTSAGFEDTNPATDTTHRPCSLPNKLPYSNVTMTEAEALCEKMGASWRLCTASEWQTACEGTAGAVFPYGATYAPTTCNGNDFPKPTVNVDAGAITLMTIPTGSATGCVSTTTGTPALKLFDMSGNVKEWAATDLATTKPGSNPTCTTPPCLFELRGGAYDVASFTVSGTTTAPGLQCDATVPAPSTTADGGATVGVPVRLPSVGFRCCHPGHL